MRRARRAIVARDLVAEPGREHARVPGQDAFALDRRAPVTPHRRRLVARQRGERRRAVGVEVEEVADLLGAAELRLQHGVGLDGVVGKRALTARPSAERRRTRRSG